MHEFFYTDYAARRIGHHAHSRFVAPDWRGFGGSSGDALTYWFPDYLADLDHLLMHYSP